MPQKLNGRSAKASKYLAEFVENFGPAVETSFTRQDCLDNRSSSYTGDIGIGINPKQKLIHVNPDAAELGRVYRPDMAIAWRQPKLWPATRNADAFSCRVNPILHRWERLLSAAKINDLGTAPLTNVSTLGKSWALSSIFKITPRFKMNL